MFRQKKDLEPCKYGFPSVDQADSDGVVCVGGDLMPSTLVEAYSRGIFPWPFDNDETQIPWFSPEERGVLEFKDLHIPRSLQKKIGKSHWKITYDRAFDEVISGCSRSSSSDQKGTWLYPFMKKAYMSLHEMGYAHSVECWSGEKLVGGLYGVLTENFFSAESMFYLESGASKYCLVKTVEHLQSIGHQWMDIQMVTPVTESFGGKYISRQSFLEKVFF